MVAHVTLWSQQYRLRQQVERSHIRHDETVRVDIPGVRVASREGRGAIISFGDVEPLKIRRRLTSGDDRPIPESVDMQGFDFPGDGIYDLKDVVVRCNGDVRISADARSRVEPHDDGRGSFFDHLFVTLTW
jgi:hypothetical protein